MSAVAASPSGSSPSAHRRFRLPFMVAFAAAAAGAGLGRAVTTTYLPVLLDRIANAPALIGAVMLVNAAAGFAIPLVVGIWSDRLRARGCSRTRPFVWGGSMVTGGASPRRARLVELLPGARAHRRDRLHRPQLHDDRTSRARAGALLARGPGEGDERAGARDAGRRPRRPRRRRRADGHLALGAVPPRGRPGAAAGAADPAARDRDAARRPRAEASPSHSATTSRSPAARASAASSSRSGSGCSATRRCPPSSCSTQSASSA